jgi:4a-hydroxytetrahydrobiopterin dehydratase
MALAMPKTIVESGALAPEGRFFATSARAFDSSDTAWPRKHSQLSRSDNMALTEQEAKQRVSKLAGWQIQAGELVKTYAFKDFRAALGFVNRVGEAAEAAGHHPDIDIRYNRVRLSLVTHDAGGLTDNDFALAAKADEVV